MCGETRVRVGFGPLPQGPRNSPPLPPYIQPLGRRLDFGFCLDQKFALDATSRILHLCSTTRPRSHRTPLCAINHSSYIRSIKIAILVSCLFFICWLVTGPQG